MSHMQECSFRDMSCCCFRMVGFTVCYWVLYKCDRARRTCKDFSVARVLTGSLGMTDALDRKCRPLLRRAPRGELTGPGQGPGRWVLLLFRDPGASGLPGGTWWK